MSKGCPVPWSNHDLISLSLSLGVCTRKEFQWARNDSLLADPSNVVLIQYYIEEYLSHNSTLDISLVTLWEAHKVVLRGDLIKLAARLKKVRKEKLVNLKDAYYVASESFKQSPNATTQAELHKARTELDLTLTELADKHLWCFSISSSSKATNRTLCLPVGFHLWISPLNQSSSN